MNFMNINWQVTPLEQAKKLKKLGVLQNSIFYWASMDREDYQITTEDGYLNWKYVRDYYSAYTVAELGVMLPIGVKYLDRVQDEARYEEPIKIGYSVGFIGKKIKRFDDKYEASARAKCLIYLLEKKIITVEEVNQRLREEL